VAALRSLGEKLVGALVAVLGASLVAFVLLRVMPGNPARLIVGPLATPAALKAQEKTMGIGQPLWTQYWKYIRGFVTGDWGFAYSIGEPVRATIASRLPATLELGFYAFLISIVLALLLALAATYRRRPVVDGLVRGLSFFGLGTPPFWFGLIALLLFSQTWHVFPGPDGRLGPSYTAPPEVTHFFTIDALIAGQWATAGNAFAHLALPAITLALAPLAFLVRLLRANLLDISRESFIVVARSKGLGRWSAATHHALPNAFLPTLTASGLLLAQLLTGSVLIEKVFNWPGVGALVVDSILRQDFAVVQTFILLSACFYVAINLLIDVLYGVIDPRVRIPTGGQ
jgi:ABC-type dipeptide/oligopeptide/nickel transport system permease component